MKKKKLKPCFPTIIEEANMLNLKSSWPSRLKQWQRLIDNIKIVFANNIYI